MQVHLKTPALAKFVDDKVKAGEFPSAEAVVEDALLQMMQNEVVLTEDDLRAIEESDQQIGRGEAIDFEDFAAQMRKKHGIVE